MPGSEEQRSGDDRRKIDFGAPAPGATGHLFDLLFFRAVAVALLYENRTTLTAETAGLVLCLFFMPDWLRGKNGVVPRAIARLFNIERDGGSS